MTEPIEPRDSAREPAGVYADHLDKSILLEETGGRSFARRFAWGAALLLVLFVAWASFLEVEERTVAKGELQPAGRIRDLDAPEDGVLAAVLARENETVRAGTCLLRLDARSLQRELEGERAQLAAALAQRQALEQARVLVGTDSGALVLGLLAQEKASLEEELRVRKALVDKELNTRLVLLGLERQRAALLRGEEERRRSLAQEEASRLERQAAAEASVAGLQARVAALELRLARLEIVAPVDGVVLSVPQASPGVMVRAGEVLARLVPAGMPLVAEVRVTGRDAGLVRAGSPARLRFSAWDPTRFGFLDATLEAVSPAARGEASGDGFFLGRIPLPRTSLDAAGACPLHPGMQVEADIRTGRKTLMQYLLKPVFAASSRAFQER